jgi:UDP-N-acetyl-D-glucosamine dehydrogenase
MKVTVVGQGYVGLPLAIALANAGSTVFGLDTNAEKIEDLKNGKSVVEDVTNETLHKYLISKNYIPTLDPKSIAESEVVLVCVPTPLSKSHEPDIASLISATKTIGKYLKKGTLIIIESTIEPGTSRDILVPLILQESGFGIEEFDFAYSPERIDPTNKKWNIRNTPKLVAGISDRATTRAVEFYKKFIISISICSSLEIAETAKLLENSFRLINISFINELAMFCHKINIDINEVVSAAGTKPYGYMPFYPSIGVGGHCIPVDPVYLANAAKSAGSPYRFIKLADTINQEIPTYFVGRAEEKLGGLKDKKILVIGVAYKSNVSDVRESPVEALIIGLSQKGAHVSWHDDLVKEWNGEKSVVLSDQYDLAIIATPHDYIDLTRLGDIPILNTRGSI